ncbi:hypothetical protein BDR22DRAFT_963290 [Usnea florida]
MPTGQKLIDWTPENDAKLFLTILAVENVHPNCEAVASAFGGPVNAVAITNRLNRLRKKAVEQGIISAPRTTTPAKCSKGNGTGKKGNGAKTGSTVVNSVENDPATASTERSTSPPTRKNKPKGQKVLTGRVTKARKSNAKITKHNDKLSDDGPAITEDNNVGDNAEASREEKETSEEEDGAAQIKDEEEDEA